MPTRAAEAAPVRVHAELRDGCLHVWLGISARCIADPVPHVSAALAALSSSGAGLGRLVVNGRTVYGAPGPNLEDT